MTAGSTRLMTGEPAVPRRSTGSAGRDTTCRGPDETGAAWSDREPLLPLGAPARAASLAPPGSRVTGAAGAAPPPEACRPPGRRPRPAPVLAAPGARPRGRRPPARAAAAAGDLPAWAASGDEMAPAPSTFFSRQSTNCPSSFVDDVGHHAPAELGGPAGDRQVGHDLHPGAVTLRFERGGDGGVGVALAPRVAALGAQDRLVAGVVLLDERRLALVLGGDRADLHLDDAAVLVAVDLLQLGARHAGRDALHVGEQLPGLVDLRRAPQIRWSAP